MLDRVQNEVATWLTSESYSKEYGLALWQRLDDRLFSSEKALSKRYLSVVGLFVAFLTMDTGIIKQVAFQGVELERIGLVMLTVPVTMSFVNYQASVLVGFIHQLRTVVALLQERLSSNLYSAGVDLLSHYPSLRNLEVYDSLLHGRSSSMMRTSMSGTVIVVVIIFGPTAASGYCLYRLWSYSDLSLTAWAIAASICLALALKGLMFRPRVDETIFLDRSGSISDIEQDVED